jgi:hypothetical protein
MIRRRLYSSTVLLFALIAGACSSAPARPHATLTAGAEPLRSAFNRDIGKTRIVMIAAPT